MNLIVLIKQVPDMEKVKFDSEKGLLTGLRQEWKLTPLI